MNLINVIKYTHNLSVLYAEDDADIRNHLVSLLENIFLKVDCFRDGLQAYNAYKNYYINEGKYYDLLITDILMPEMDGIELSKKVLQISPKQHIIAISAYNERENLQALGTLGVDSFIQKPIKIENLFDVIKKIAILMNKNTTEYEKLQKLNCDITFVMDSINHVALLTRSDTKGNLIYANDAFCKISKYTKEELSLGTHNIFENNNITASVFNNIWENLNKGNLWKGNIMDMAKDGTTFYTQTNIIPVFNQNRIITEYVSIKFLINNTHDLNKNDQSPGIQLESYKEQFSKTIELLTKKNKQLYFDKKADSTTIKKLLEKIVSLENKNAQLTHQITLQKKL